MITSYALNIIYSLPEGMLNDIEHADCCCLMMGQIFCGSKCLAIFNKAGINHEPKSLRILVF